MNIKEAKKQIKNAMIAYFSKDEFGNYQIPVEKQRPVFLIGPPGIGKTAIMEQIASEMGVGILSYSMTHHTRQSALGLPKIKSRIYDDVEYDISEYTMSEIIASVYDLIEKSKIREGILFLDEINCVSETLTPVMLQFLQYKIFGKHRVPDGWIVVTAGNPPEYNKSVRSFDIATWDRLKRIDIEPDFNAWKDYAYESNIHPSILTYLEIKKDDFYSVESTVDGKQFVTARGWDDLSQMIYLYEKNNIEVDRLLISQYLQNSKIAKSFSNYYELFKKYKSDYQVPDILDGKANEDIINRAKVAKFDERLALIGLMLDGILDEINVSKLSDDLISDLMNVLKRFKLELKNPNTTPLEIVQNITKAEEENLNSRKAAKNIPYSVQKNKMRLISILKDFENIVASISNPLEAFKVIKEEFDKQVLEIKGSASKTRDKVDNMFKFAVSSWGEGQEVLILVTELTANKNSASFISKYGSDMYFKYNKEMQFYERGKQVLDRLDELNI